MDIERWRRMPDEALGRELLRSGHITPAVLMDLAIAALIVLIVYGQIAKRAGYSRWLALGLLVPVVGGLLPIVFAAVPWPVERKRVSPTKRRRNKR